MIYAIIISTIALCLSVFNLLQANGIIHVKNKVDKYADYRNSKGLYGSKPKE